MKTGVLTPEHPNAVAVRAAVEAGGRGDLAAMHKTKSAAMIVHPSGGTSPIGAGAKNRDELDAQDAKMFELSNKTLAGVPLYVVGNDEQVIVALHATAERDGKTLDAVMLQVWRMENGICVEAWNYFNDQKAWDEFWN